MGGRGSCCTDNKSQDTLPANAVRQQTSVQIMTIRFETDSGTKDLQFDQKPLGLNFGKMAEGGRTLKQVRPGSAGELAGAQVGWKILAINGEDMTHYTGQLVHAKFSEAVGFLASVNDQMASPRDRTASGDQLKPARAESGYWG